MRLYSKSPKIPRIPKNPDIPKRFLYLICTLLSFALMGACDNPHLQMVSEVVELDEGEGGHWRAKVSYQFKGRVFRRFSIAFPEPAEYRLENFRRTWNGVSLIVEKVDPESDSGFVIAPKINSETAKEKTSEKSKYVPILSSRVFTAKHVSYLPITLREKSTLIDEYIFYPPFIDPGTKSDLPPGRFIEYLLESGSTWEGEIESIEVYVRRKDMNCKRIWLREDSYAGYCNEEGIWRASLRDIKPDKNIRLILD